MITKALAIFLSLYIILLSGIHCDDIAIVHSSQQTEYSQAATSASHGDIDHCSPFCTCQCCHACFYITDQSLDFTIIGFGLKYHENRTMFKSADLLDFLIPPKA